MKKLFLFLLASGGALSTFAQEPADKHVDSVKMHRHYAKDALLSHWLVDVNLIGGGVSQTFTAHNNIGNYLNGIASVSNTGNLSFSNGLAYGFDAQLAYFFGRKNNFGIGAGFMYLAEQGDTKLDKFHVEYQSTDGSGSTFRQLITSNGAITEKMHITDLNIPVLLKYKHRLSQKWGITADAGALFNLQMSSRYSSNANFNYEAVYRLQGSGDNLVAVYDNTPVPNPSQDHVITKSEYIRVNPGLDVNNYFNNVMPRNIYNVGLGLKPNNNTGTVSYVTGSVGFLVQPGVNYYLSDMVALNLGAYFLYQPFQNKSNTNMLSNKIGDYSSVLYSAKDNVNMSYGLNLGVRVYLGKGKDSDGDGIPDRLDRCPDVFGTIQFNGCPDSDGDGIADVDDACPRVPGIAKFNGCPDSDGDGIMDKDDACPYAPGTAKFKGCPDKDGDGIIDKDDACPDKAGLAIYHGCPDTDGDGIPDNEDACPNEPGPADNHGCPVPPKPAPSADKISIPILFEVDKTIIHKSSYPTIIEAAKRLNDEPEAIIIVDGYTDNTGSKPHNKVLSLRRAQAVKNKLIDMGIDAKRVKVVGHSEENPVAPNDTPENKLKNRRAVMHLSVGE
jgi:outer membrane protein OmpA-like peptidoglycan-associated protein